MNHTKKITLALLTVSLTTIFSISYVHAQTVSQQQTPTVNYGTSIDTTDYFGQASKIFDEEQRISSAADNLQLQITNLKASNSANNVTINAMITSLQNQLEADRNQIT